MMRRRYWPYSVFSERGRKVLELCRVDVAHPVGDLLEAGDLEALPLLDGRTKSAPGAGCVVPVSSQAMPRPRCRPGVALARDSARLTSVISSSPRGDGLELGGDVDDAGCRRNKGRSPRSCDLRLLRLLLDARPPGPPRRTRRRRNAPDRDLVGEDRGAVRWRRRAAVLAQAVAGEDVVAEHQRAGSPPMNSRPMMNACARPSGFGWTAYLNAGPIARRRRAAARNAARSSGVVITRMSRMPASIRVEAGNRSSACRRSAAVAC